MDILQWLLTVCEKNPILASLIANFIFSGLGQIAKPRSHEEKLKQRMLDRLGDPSLIATKGDVQNFGQKFITFVRELQQQSESELYESLTEILIPFHKDIGYRLQVIETQLNGISEKLGLKEEDITLITQQAAEEFETMGPIIDPSKQIYIERPEDTEILQTVARGNYVTLLGARQTGKTSLLYKLARELKIEVPIFVDLSRFSGLERTEWYNHVAKELVRRLPENIGIRIIGEPSCSNQTEFSLLIKNIADATDRDRLILMLDEIGTVPVEIRDHFFSGIRAIYNGRGVDKGLQKYIVVLSGAMPPEELISSESGNSPFNVSKPIYMSDFSLEGVRRLGENLRLYGFKIDDSVIRHIYGWTHGHPNLTQEIFSGLVNLEEETISNELVDQIVKLLLVRGCNNLRHIRRYLYKEENEYVRQTVVKILKKQFKSKFTETGDPLVTKMNLIGLVRSDEDGNVVIHNQIYEQMLESIQSIG